MEQGAEGSGPGAEGTGKIAFSQGKTGAVGRGWFVEWQSIRSRGADLFR